MTTTTAAPIAGRHTPSSANSRWALAITSLALFMVTLDNLVVTPALGIWTGVSALGAGRFLASWLGGEKEDA